MRKCHVCQAENEDDAPRCVACNARLRKRDRHSMDAPDSPFAPQADPINQPAVRAYYAAVWGLLPLVGLIQGPLAVYHGIRANRQGRNHPGYIGQAAAWFGIVLGSAETVTQWVGLLLMYWGLTA